jgi:hypothetical protein
MKIVNATLWITSNGAFERKMDSVSDTMEGVIGAMRRLAPQIALNDARDAVRRAAFDEGIVWFANRSIGVKVQSVIDDRFETRDCEFLLDDMSIRTPNCHGIGMEETVLH